MKRHRIEQVWAFVSDDAEGEGVVAAMTKGGAWLPLVGADMERVEALRPIAQMIASDSGKPIRVLRFSVREELELIEPKKGD
jgi:hypothetical protein